MDINMIESNLIFGLYKDIDTFHEYISKINPINDFEKEESIFYYTMGREIIKQGYKNIDQLAVATYLQDKPSLKSFYDSLGGWQTIHDITSIANENNVDKYFDELIKHNVFKKLKSKGFTVDENKFNNVTSQEVYAYYEKVLDDSFIHNDTDIKIETFDIDDSYIERKHKGVGMGASIALHSPRLNYDISGLHKGNLSIFAGFSGSGKSSWMLENVVVPLVEQGYKYTIISNEQVLDEFRDTLLVMVMAQKFKYFGITRKRLKAGDFSSEEFKNIRLAQDYINKNYSDKLKFVKMFEYDISATKKVIRKLANEGCAYFMYDTFKSEDSANSNSTGLMVEYSKELFQLCSKLNIHIMMTQQLAIYMNNTRYLTSACLSNSKQVAEVADVIILMRQTWDDEMSEQLNDIKPYNFMKDANGQYKKDDGKSVKEMFTLDEEERNMILFLDKNRHGEDKKTYVTTFNGRYNIWHEKGFCHVHTKNRF